MSRVSPLGMVAATGVERWDGDAARQYAEIQLA